MSNDRRTFLKAASVLSGLSLMSLTEAAASSPQERLHVAVNQYSCDCYFRRDAVPDFRSELTRFKAAGIDGLEPSVATGEDVKRIAEQLKAAGLEMRSLYTGADFYTDDARAEATEHRIMELAKVAREYGTKMIVSNPDAKQGKSDEEIFRQTRAYENLGRKLLDLGMHLAIHYHTTEWEFGGREILHLMGCSNPEFVKLCFDTHWSFRACGNSNAAVRAHLQMYAPRVVEFHLRQSRDGVWTETFDEGDIDHAFIAEYFRKHFPGKMPHIVLEQAPENGTPTTMKTLDVFQKSAEFLRKIFSQP